MNLYDYSVLQFFGTLNVDFVLNVALLACIFLILHCGSAKIGYIHKWRTSQKNLLFFQTTTVPAYAFRELFSSTFRSTSNQSIQQAKMPQRDYVEVALFNIVFHNEAFGRVLNLFEAFVFATHFKIAVVDAEIGHRRRIHLMLNAGLIEEKGFPYVPHILIFVAQLLHQIGVIEIDLINLSQGPNAFGFAS